MEKSKVDLWASFLANEKLVPERIDENWLLKMIQLCEEAAKVRGPKVRPHKARLEARDFIVGLAMDLGIDLPAIKYRGKMLMARSLLDAWNRVYVKKHGSTYGTASAVEAKRRDIVTRLSKEFKE